MGRAATPFIVGSNPTGHLGYENNLNNRKVEKEKKDIMNTMLKNMKEVDNYKYTENGALCYSSTMNKVMDLFAFGGAYRHRSDDDCILLFKEAFEEDALLALKCLFYLSDIRGGQGERRFFRVCYRWLAINYPEVARKNLYLIPVYRRWDDILYSCVDTPIMSDAFAFIKGQLALDVECKTPSLLAKWLPSENASSNQTKRMGNIIRSYLGMTHKQYRKTLSDLRSRINIVEKLMSENRWNEIEFDKLPSKAGLIYKNAFATNDITKERYAKFAEDRKAKVNAGSLYPYEIIGKIFNEIDFFEDASELSETDRLMYQKYWDNLPDYFNGNTSNILCMIDTSGSMCGRGAAAPINVATSIGIYAAERSAGPFKNHYISFSHNPQLIEVKGTDIADKAIRIRRANLCENTNLTKAFDYLLDIADLPSTREEDIPEQIIVISDLEIDYMTTGINRWSTKGAITEMEKVRHKWSDHGHKMPKLVYWCVNSRSNTILEKSDGVSFVSGMSPVIFQSILTGKTGWELLLTTICVDRYKDITI